MQEPDVFTASGIGSRSYAHSHLFAGSCLCRGQDLEDAFNRKGRGGPGEKKEGCENEGMQTGSLDCQLDPSIARNRWLLGI